MNGMIGTHSNMRKDRETKPKRDKVIIIKGYKGLKKTKILLHICGIGFFLDYFHQVEMLNKKNLKTDEDFSLIKKELRLKAAQIIIDKDLTILAVSIILSKRMSLNSSEIKKAYAILNYERKKLDI